MTNRAGAAVSFVPAPRPEVASCGMNLPVGSDSSGSTMNRRSAEVSQPNDTARGDRSLQRGSFVRSLDTGFAVGVYVHVQGHRVAADRAVLDVVLVRAPGNVHRDHDLFAARVADIRGFKLCYGLPAAAFGAFLGHVTQKCSPSPSAG